MDNLLFLFGGSTTLAGKPKRTTLKLDLNHLDLGWEEMAPLHFARRKPDIYLETIRGNLSKSWMSFHNRNKILHYIITSVIACHFTNFNPGAGSKYRKQFFFCDADQGHVSYGICFKFQL